MRLDGISNIFDEDSFANIYDDIPMPEKSKPCFLHFETGAIFDIRWGDSVQRGPNMVAGLGSPSPPLYTKNPYKGKFTALWLFATAANTANGSADNNVLYFALQPFIRDVGVLGSQLFDKSEDYTFGDVQHNQLGTNNFQMLMPLYTRPFDCSHDVSIFSLNDAVVNINARGLIGGYITYDD